MLENLTGGGVNGSGNPDGRVTLNLKIHSLGLLSISSMFQLLQWINFQKNCFAFSNFIIFSNYRPLTTFILSFHPWARLRRSDVRSILNFKISRKIASFIKKLVELKWSKQWFLPWIKHFLKVNAISGRFATKHALQDSWNLRDRFGGHFERQVCGQRYSQSCNIPLSVLFLSLLFLDKE